MIGTVRFLGQEYSVDQGSIRPIVGGRPLYEAPPETEILKAEGDGQSRLFVLFRGKRSASKTNLVALDPTGGEVWKAKADPTEFDDELVGFKVKGAIVEVWSWNVVYTFECVTGKVLRQEPNK
jgi:hypothetical protein